MKRCGFVRQIESAHLHRTASAGVNLFCPILTGKRASTPANPGTLCERIWVEKYAARVIHPKEGNMNDTL